MHALVCGQLRKEDEWFLSCQEPYFVMSVSAEQIIPAAEGIRKNDHIHNRWQLKRQMKGSMSFIMVPVSCSYIVMV